MLKARSRVRSCKESFGKGKWVPKLVEGKIVRTFSFFAHRNTDLEGLVPRENREKRDRGCVFWLQI